MRHHVANPVKLDDLTCGHDPGPEHEDLSEVVGVADHAVPARAEDALPAHRRDGVQVAQGGVRRVLKQGS